MHYNIPGHAHELTFSVYRRRNLFYDRIACEFFLGELALARNEFRFGLWAYVLMPNHVHLLLWPATGSKIETIAKAIKGRMAKRYVQEFREQGTLEKLNLFRVVEKGVSIIRIWQRGGGFDRNLFNPVAIRDSIEYIEANPVRKALCGSPGEYRWSSAWARVKDEGVVPDTFHMPVVMMDARKQRIGKV
jgi:putative transposase